MYLLAVSVVQWLELHLRHCVTSSSVFVYTSCNFVRTRCRRETFTGSQLTPVDCGQKMRRVAIEYRHLVNAHKLAIIKKVLPRPGSSCPALQLVMLQLWSCMIAACCRITQWKSTNKLSNNARLVAQTMPKTVSTYCISAISATKPLISFFCRSILCTGWPLL